MTLACGPEQCSISILVQQDRWMKTHDLKSCRCFLLQSYEKEWRAQKSANRISSSHPLEYHHVTNLNIIKSATRISSRQLLTAGSVLLQPHLWHISSWDILVSSQRLEYQRDIFKSAGPTFINEDSNWLLGNHEYSELIHSLMQGRQPILTRKHIMTIPCYGFGDRLAYLQY